MRIEATGPAPAAEVWRRYTDPAEWPSWSPQITGVVGTVDPVLPGDRGWVLGPLWARAPFEVLSVEDEACRWSWRVGMRPVAVTMEHGVDGTDEGSAAWVDVHAPWPLVVPYLPLARLALKRLVS
ncbi:SRPBCC family protein [Nocardioides coralli]|uniref:SRPBCC family protein n=1 Tax=Nocardioides coralli TaxID=2872154 RepID=UPI001CA45B12|nr:SRPBCC family protein [Nocardioides coralli]QZY29740.1 SRPBCC family protein [Nocardioides coralli]